MKGFLTTVPVVLILLTGCATQPSNSLSTIPAEPTSVCLGTAALPEHLTPFFDEVNDPALLASTLGETDQGKLCQGKVYQAKANTEVPVYRAWNSTNPNSQFGNWWAFDQPSGLTAQYREAYEICYQWSPLDKLVSCQLSAGSKIVVGNGQSATCSEYLTYEKSPAQQVYLENASEQTLNCDVKDAVFSWR
ncbi:MAG: hypothetical protein ACPHUL_11490 [Marinomonas gallaica]